MLDKHFDFANKETEIFAKWEKAGVFKLDAGVVGQRDDAPIYDNVLPPPNANGELHIGHCYGYTVMDVLGRYHRLRGERVLLLPGKDHAGIQTQVVFEKKLRSEGVDLEKMSRQEFWDKCYAFCTDRASYMRAQEKLMGTSADYDREIFTLDPRVSAIVNETFLKMWKDGLVYRGSRMVHWSVYSQTSISDVEVEYKEEKGHLWHIEYPFVEETEKPERKRLKLPEDLKMLHNNGNHWVILTSSADETVANLKIGEVLIENSLKDGLEIERDFIVFGLKKYANGKALKEDELSKYSENLRAVMQEQKEQFVLIDLVPDLDRTDAVIVATTRPETMLGDTAVAVHPADPRYSHLVGKTLRVPLVNREIPIIADDRIDISFGTGAVKVTPAHDFTDNQIGHDHKLEVIQVIDKFGKMTEAAGRKYLGMSILEGRAAVVEDLKVLGRLLLVEEISHKVPISERGKDIIEPLISTQWFIAVDQEGNSLKKRAIDLVKADWMKVYPGRLKNIIIQWLENLNDWNISRQIMWGHRLPVWYKNKDQANEKIEVSVEQPAGEGWVQENDTFDTWFSSGQWAYSTLAAEQLLNLHNPTTTEFFPTHTMVMGRDLLFFWACRMLLLSSYRLNEIPFKNLYFTGLLRDSKGQKMSKSKGNGVEPKEMLDKYGADALRIGLLAGSTPGLDLKFSEKKIEGYAKFVNKIWNAAKLVDLKVENHYDWKVPDWQNLKLNSSRWILQEISQVMENYHQKLENYELSAAFEIAYHFAWDTFCSWYLEISKTQTDSEQAEEVKAVMLAGLEKVLLLLHPFMPFFTEEIHENMGRFGSELMLAQKILGQKLNVPNDHSSSQEIGKIFDAVTAAREVRKVLGKGFSDRLKMDFQFTIKEEEALVMEKMTNLEKAELSEEEAIVIPYSSGIVMIKATAEEKTAFKNSLQKTLAKKKQEWEVLEKILTAGFKAKADPDLVQEREGQLAQIKAEIATIEKDLSLN